MSEEIVLGIGRITKSEEVIANGVPFVRTLMTIGNTSPVYNSSGELLQNVYLRANAPVGEHYELVLRKYELPSPGARKFRDEGIE